MELNKANYHSAEANRHFMSNSQYKDFLTCEAGAMAKINGWVMPTNGAFTVGSYVHAWLEGTLDEFKSENANDIYKKNGEPYSEFARADDMIRALEQDKLCMFVLQGQKEIIMTAGFAGSLWKIRMDVYNPDKGRIADLKTVESIGKKYWDADAGAYVSFIENYKYVTQMAIYAEVEKRHSGRSDRLETLLVAVSKEDVPDKEVINFDEERLQLELEQIESNMPRIIAVKNGLEQPNRCGKCRYCRETKQLGRIIHYSELVV